MGEPGSEIDVFFVGQTGVGKSSLINMIRGVQDPKKGGARVSNDARPCTTEITSYSTSLGPGLKCRLWDTRGLGEAVDLHDRSFMFKMIDRIRQLAYKQGRELKEALQGRTRLAAFPILVWCIEATKIDIPSHWEQFRMVYVDYCECRATPVVVITQMHPDATGWESRCSNQLRDLDLGAGPGQSMDVPLIRMRKHRNTSSPEYNEDTKAIKDLISDLIKR